MFIPFCGAETWTILTADINTLHGGFPHEVLATDTGYTPVSSRL